MIYLGNLEKVDELGYKVGLIHYHPFDKINGLGKTEEELNLEGILIPNNSLPSAEDMGNKIPVLMADKITGECWYEYEDTPVLSDESVNNQQELINTLGQEIASLKLQLIVGGVL